MNPFGCTDAPPKSEIWELFRFYSEPSRDNLKKAPRAEIGDDGEIMKNNEKKSKFHSLEVHPYTQMGSHEGAGWFSFTSEVSGCIFEQLFSKQNFSIFYRKMWNFRCLDIGAFGGILRLHEAPEWSVWVERCRHTHQNVRKGLSFR